VRAEGAQVKIEVTPVLRGCVYDPQLRSVSAGVEEEFGFGEIQVVSFADLYAGKIVAALDRQPRATSSMSAIFWRTKGSATSCAAPSSSISSAQIVLSPNSSRPRAWTSRKNLRAASTA